MQNQELIDAISAAIGAHGTWKHKLMMAISRGESEASPETVKCDDKCDFGQWLYGPTMTAEIKSGMPYIVVRRLHAEFHVCASQVLEDALNGNTAKAKEAYDGEFKERSQILVKALNKWKRELMVAAAA